ncbi:MAG: hypothetical protein JO182_15110 [Acidobacteriaceae bacterium]|nr:hypothetical protein [Acidobacteriaceae bacterium]
MPLTIQFSAPNGDALTRVTQGQALQWYQPPWEPGNIFSYPANLAQLKRIYPNLDQLTNGGVQFLTDTSTITQQTTWSRGKKTSSTTSFDQNYSFENELSVTGSVGVTGIKAEAGVSLNLSGSYGLSNLNRHTTDLGSSTGIEVSKPRNFPNFNLFGYWVAPHLMGTTKPGGVVDSQSLKSDIQTFGVLRAMFTADLLASGAGAWWTQAYCQAPDVALNHPARWQNAGSSDSSGANCLGTFCAQLARRSPENPMLSVFHQMCGFFISNAQSSG